MRVLLKISPLLLCIIASQTVFADPDFADCKSDIDTIVHKYESSIYGGLNAFYDINKGISDGLQKTMSDQMVTDIYNYIEGNAGHKSLGTIINDVVKSQAGAIAFFCVGLIFILVSLILAITICSCRCCCNSCGAKKDDITYPSVWSAAGMIAGLVSIFAFVLTGVIIFNISSNNLYSAVDQSPAWIADVVNGLNGVVTQGTTEMNCTIETTVDTTFSGLEAQMRGYPQSLTYQYKNNTGLDALNSFDFVGLQKAIDQAQEQITQIQADIALFEDNTPECKKAKDDAAAQVEKTKNDLDRTSADVVAVETANTEAQAQITANSEALQTKVQQPIEGAIQNMQKAQSDITSGMSTIIGAVNQTMQTVYSLQNAIDTAYHDITTWSGYKHVQASWQAAMSIPNCICLLFALLTVVFLCLWIFKGNDTPRGLGYAAIIGFYCVIFIAWVAMAVSSVTFLGGWAISGVCKPMFEDSTFRVYGIADALSYQIKGFDGTSSNITFQQLLQKCSAKDTMFKAIGGDQLISVTMVMNMLDLNAQLKALNTAIDNAPLTYTFPDADSNSLANDHKDIQDDIDALSTPGDYFKDCANSQSVHDANVQIVHLTASLRDISDQLNNLQQLVATVTTSATDPNNEQQKLLEEYTNTQFQIANTSISTSISQLITQLDTNTFPCYPLYLSFENAGTIMCDWFGRPVHGMWGAAGLAAIFFIPAALLLLCASKTLFTGLREKSFKSADERTLYAYVAPSSVHRAKTTQDLWAEEEDPFALPKIRSDAPQPLPRVSTNDYYPSQPTAAAAAPWLDDSVSKGSGLRRTDEGLQRSDNYNPYGTESGLRRNDYPESSRRLGGDERWGSDAGSGSSSRGLRRVDDDVGGNQPEEERWSNSALRRL